jgi:hypothetical protein
MHISQAATFKRKKCCHTYEVQHNFLPVPCQVSSTQLGCFSITKKQITQTQVVESAI